MPKPWAKAKRAATALVVDASGLLPRPLLRRLLRLSLSDQVAALCLHRLGDRPGDSTFIPAPELDALLDLLLESKSDQQRWLTVCFDDGYAEAGEYIASRLERYPTIDWIMFVCPEKTEKRAGFRWDLAAATGIPQSTGKGLEPRTENMDPALLGIAARPEFSLATVEQLQHLAGLPHVALGNHTNAHFKLTRMSLEDAREELRRSTDDFTRLFGQQRHFAIPFGTPGLQFDERHVEILHGLGDFLIWSTEMRAYELGERSPGAVLPRFPIDGTRSYRELAGWLALRAALGRLRAPAKPALASERTAQQELD